LNYSSELKIHFIIEDGGSWGVAYLSSYIKSKFENVKLSCSIIGEDIAASIHQIRPDIIGISSTSRSFITGVRLADKIKKEFSIPIILGGIHLSLRPDELPESVDIGVIGEGELTLEELLLNFSDGRFSNLDRIPGIVYRKNDQIFINPRRPFIENLDMLPYPDLQLIRGKFNIHTPPIILTSRGCPYKCRFCASSIFWDKTRFHSPEYVIKEMTHLVNKYKVKEMQIFDDLFTANRKRVESISEYIAKSPVLSKIRFVIYIRADRFDEEMARCLKKMKVHAVSFGIESGCQKTLEYLKNKTLTIEQVENALNLLEKYKIKKIGSFIIGSPYETADEIKQTFDFILKHKFDAVQITIATPFPGTVFWNDGVKSGKITGNEWKDEYHALFDVNPDVNIRELLKDKILMTPIDRETFLNLAEEAAEIENRINFRKIFYFRKFLVNIIKKCHPSRLLIPYFALKKG
jgi:anaerobic magnesium-protoporphyrin IX monomethyl ester cyclase